MDQGRRCRRVWKGMIACAGAWIDGAQRPDLIACLILSVPDF